MSYYGSGYGRAMVRGGRSYSSSRGSYRGSPRGNSWNGGGGYGRSSRDRFSFEGGYDKGGKYGSDRYSRMDDYPKAYRMDNYSPRDRHSPERKRLRTEGPSSRHDSYGARYDPYPNERRGYSGERERHFSSSSPYSSRREEFRRPPPPPSPRGSNRGRLSSRGPRGMRRDRGGPPRRRMMDRSYVIRKRGLIRSSDYTRRSKLIRLRSTLSRRRRAISSEKESSGDEKEDSKEPKEKKEKAENAEGDEEKEVKEGEEKEGDEKMEVTEEGGEKKEKPKEKKEKKEDAEDKKKKIFNYIKLNCPQCNVKVSTFRRYEAHLQGKTHLFAMRKTAAKQRSILAQMRQAQRNAQNELEKTGENITEHTVFCPLCKLNYKQERKVHQNSAAHKNMRKFLMPVCKVCKVTFKSPMVYENHLCSIDHLKRKQRVENASDGEEDNLDEFTTIDSVGELDENAASNEEAEKEEKKKDKVSVGIEQIKKIESYYCDLCRMFLPRGTENEYPDILAGHCRKRFHMQRYIRHKENEELKKRAEKLQRKETAEKEKKKVEPKKEEGTSVEDVEMKEESKEEGEAKEGDTTKTAEDDKLWEAVDKDLGELLEETDGNKSDDDDEDSRVNGERFDRFKSAEKEKQGEDAKDAQETEKPGEQADEVKKEEESK